MGSSETKRTGSTDNYEETVREATDSVEVTRSARGKYHWSIKVYGYPGDMNSVVSRAFHLDATLRACFKGEIEE